MLSLRFLLLSPLVLLQSVFHGGLSGKPAPRELSPRPVLRKYFEILNRFCSLGAEYATFDFLGPIYPAII